MRAKAPLPSVDRFTGCLLGGAIGDALGVPIEFDESASVIVARFGSAPPARLAYSGRPALVSDDTQMTLFTAEGLIRGFQRMSDRGICSMTGCLHAAYLRWYFTQTGVPDGMDDDDPAVGGWLFKEEALRVRRAPGNTCLSALARNLETGAMPSLDSPPNDSKGCGAVMRSAPIGLVTGSRELAFKQARDAGVLTHGHPSGYLSAAYFASVIFDLVRDVPLPEAMNAADALLAPERGSQETIAVIRTVKRLATDGPPTPEVIESIGGGWVGEQALGIALLCTLTARGSSPEAIAEALWRSVVHAGDSDSTGSLTGNLLGAMHGGACLPAAWLAELELRDIVDRVAQDLHAVAVRGKKLDHALYPPN